MKEGFWVFVSHSTKDFERVRLVRNALEDSGFRPILFYLKCMEDEDEINELIKREIDARRRFILCDSSNAKASKFVQTEVDYIKSQQRMCEVVDLSYLEGPDVENRVQELIKPFIRRVTVFISRPYKDCDILVPLFSYLHDVGFNVIDPRWGLAQNEIPYINEETVKIHIKKPLDNGYMIAFDENNISTYSLMEIEFAYEIDPSRILIVIYSDFIFDNSDVGLRLAVLFEKKKHYSNYIYLSNNYSPIDNAKAIVEKLVSFDLENQYKQS